MSKTNLLTHLIMQVKLTSRNQQPKLNFALIICAVVFVYKIKEEEEEVDKYHVTKIIIIIMLNVRYGRVQLK